MQATESHGNQRNDTLPGTKTQKKTIGTKQKSKCSPP